MVLQQVELMVAEGQQAAIEAAVCEVRQRLFMCTGFRGFEVLQGLEDPSRYLVRVTWETPEELLALADSGVLERAWSPVEPLLARPYRAEHFVERRGLGDQGPGVITDLSWMSA